MADRSVLRQPTIQADDTLLSLPGLMVALYLDEVDDLPNIRPHQAGAALAFLTALGALCLDSEQPHPTSEDWWRTRLLTLSNGSEEAWTLVVEDCSVSAFLQPGTPAGARPIARKRPVRCPDGLDVLVTSKSWDQKATVMTDASAEAWVWALVCLQTTAPFGGFGTYGVIRMNGGFSSRCMTGRARSLRWGARFRADAELMVLNRAVVADTYGFDSDGVRLLWTRRWSGDESLDPTALHPWAIEVCRRVRLVRGSDGSIEAFTQSTKGPRVEARSRNGLLGDPWLPTHKENPRAFSLTSRGFSYDVMRQVILGDADLQAPMALGEGSGSVVWASGVAGGSGRTAGHHERALFVPPPLHKAMFEDEGPAIAEAGEHMVRLAAVCRAKVLYPALLALLNHGRESGRRSGDQRPQRFMEQFERLVDDAYFPHLFTWAPDEDVDDWNQEWAKTVFHIAMDVFRDAVQLSTGSSQHGWAGIVAGERILYGSARKNLNLDWSHDDAA